jgi:DNA mismatch repair protein MutS2
MVHSQANSSQQPQKLVFKFAAATDQITVYKMKMDEKTLDILEYPKILEHLAGYCAFPVSVEKAGRLLPTSDMDEILRRQAETSEALHLLSVQTNLTIGGARDIREAVELASRSGVLTTSELLDIKFTMIAARNLERTFERLGEQYPHLCDIAAQLPPPSGLINAISTAISDRGDILDSASTELGNIRRQLRVIHDRLMSKLERIVGDPKNGPMLQEAIITQRDGRYVLPLRAEFKGRIKSIIHDQSASGATLFIEPLSVVEPNNQYRELQLAERDEEQRILAELSQMVGSNAEILYLMLDTVAELDLAFARGKYAEHLSGSEPVLQSIRTKDNRRHPGSIIRLHEARHPLLDPQTVVPIDVELDPQTYALVITGPNTGGKTVTLKTVGLLALMAQSGLHIPAQSGSEISVFRDIYADIGDEQSIEQSLSTFSGHINNIIRILEVADQHSLVILDELGAGTDPQEGAALARALLTTLLDKGITTLVTTHHPELKAFAHTTAGVLNASAEFNLETLQPTYHLTIGLPGRSNALAIAQRLGMPSDIIKRARSELNPEDLEAEGLLDEIHRQRDLARQARTAAEVSRQEGDVLVSELAARLESIEDERRAVLEIARAEAEKELEELRDEMRQVRRALAQARQPLEILKSAEEQVEILEEIVEEPVTRQKPEVDGKPIHRPVRLGDKVRLRSLDTQGVVTTLGEEEAEVQVGMLRIRARLTDLQPLTGDLQLSTEDRPKVRTGEVRHLYGSGEGPSAGFTPSPGLEIDLRGKRADEAIDALDSYLDSAYLAGLPFVRIIHGKGTGKLRLVVREALQDHPQVKSFEAGGDKEGGEGVTVAKLRN